MIELAEVLDEQIVTAMRDALDDVALFEDGALTAGWAARPVKNNLQAKTSSFERGLVGKVETALLKHPVFQAYARPKALVRTRISRSEPGMGYGWHTDDPVIEGARTDLSFTVFLTPPESYEGGELAISDTSGETDIKLPAGHAIVYPSTTLHQVRPVQSGVRLVAFGWVRSFIPRADMRALLFDLDIAVREVFGREGKSATFDRLAKVKANLTRICIDDGR